MQALLSLALSLTCHLPSFPFYLSHVILCRSLLSLPRLSLPPLPSLPPFSPSLLSHLSLPRLPLPPSPPTPSLASPSPSPSPLSLQAIVVSFGMAFWATCVQYKMCSFWMGVSLVNTQLVYETGQMMVRTATSLSRPYLPRPLSI